jgi:signal transduction histidine kinase
LRAVANLLDNAGKYSTPGTPIRLLARRAGHSVQISVEDQGAGIPPEEQGKLFEKFVRGAEARRSGIRGVGIGLALVKAIAEAHGGAVQIASEPGRGCKFTLEIPCHES